MGGGSSGAVPVRWLVSLLSVVLMLTLAVPVLKKIGKIRSESPPRTARPPTGVARDSGPERAPATVTVPHSVTVYRWRDTDGVVHYESRPPPDGLDVEVEVLQMVGEREVPVPQPIPD